MPDNSYLPTLQFQPYVSAVNQEPTKEVDDLGKVLNQRYEENIAQFDKFDELAHQLQVSEADQSLKQGLLTDTRNAISNIATNGNWEDAKVPIREIARRFANDPILTKAATNYQTAKKLDELQEQAEIRGEPQIRFKDYRNFATVDPLTGKARDLTMDGVYEKKLDYEAKMNQMFDGIQNSGASSGSTDLQLGNNGEVISQQVKNGWSGITKKTIIDAANRNFNSYLASGEGQQRLKVLTTKNSENGQPVDTPTALNLMKQELINAGLNRVHMESEHIDAQKIPRQFKNPSANPDGSLQSDISYQRNQDLGDISKYLDDKMNPARVLKPVDMTGHHGEKFMDFGIGWSGANPNAMLGLGKGQLSEAGNLMYKNLSDVFSSQLNTKDPKIIDPYIKKYITNIQNSKIQPVLLAPDKTADIDKQNNYFRNGQYEASDYFDPKTNKQLSWQQIKEGYTNDKGNKISDEDIKDAKIVGDYSPDNPFYDMNKQNPDFATAKKVIIGGHDFVLGATAQDKSTSNYQLNNLMAKLTSPRRLGLPIQLSNDLKVIPSPDNKGYYIQQKDNAPRGKNDGTPLSIDDLMNIVTKHGITVK